MNWIIGLTVTRIESFLFDDLISLLRFVYRLRNLSYSVVFMRTNSHGIDQGNAFHSNMIPLHSYSNKNSAGARNRDTKIQKITWPQKKCFAFLSVGDLQKYEK